MIGMVIPELKRYHNIEFLKQKLYFKTFEAPMNSTFAKLIKDPMESMKIKLNKLNNY
jgi:hypothetical protein